MPSSVPPSSLPLLRFPHSEARKLLEEQARAGLRLLEDFNALAKSVLPPPDQRAISVFRYGCSSWHEATKTLLRKLFSTDEIANGYHNSTAQPPSPDGESRASMQGQLVVRIRALRQIEERLHLYEEASLSRESGPRASPDYDPAKVFVVHGHDEASLHATARFLAQLDLRAVVLREQPNSGRTIIEKLIDYSDVGYAVVLLTPDDRGGLATDSYEQQRLRARQNVILELGFFLGILGRDRVCALYGEGADVPSDYSGVVFVPLDGAGAWRLLLAREMKAAGLAVDLNKAV